MPHFIWTDRPEICGGTSLRREGNFSAGPLINSEEKALALENRRRLFSGLGFPDWHTLKQTHSTAVHRAGAGEGLEGDALITDTPGQMLAINTADCIPVFFYAPAQKAIGLAHSGRLGLLNGIGERTLEALKTSFNAEPENILVHIGPHISASSYEVGADILGDFGIPCGGERGYLDMEGELRRRLGGAGVRSINITTSGLCTLAAKEGGRPLFFSHRGGDRQRMFSFLGLYPSNG